MAEFFNMGGYAFFVWMSYGLAALILILNILIPKWQHKTIVNRLTDTFKRQDAKQ